MVLTFVFVVGFTMTVVVKSSMVMYVNPRTNEWL